MKIAIYTLGCKVNQYETQAMERLLRARGHEIVDFSAAADAYVVNSCSVTAVSDQKSRQALHKIRRERPGAALALCGCYAQTHPEDMEGLDVDLVAGTGDRMGFIALLEKAAEERARVTAIDRAFDRREFEVLPAGGRLRQLLLLLHHPLRPGAGALSASGAGGGAGGGSGGGGLPGDRADGH